jgi:hypothetical protein
MTTEVLGYLLCTFLPWGFCILLAGGIAGGKHRTLEGLLLGFFLGPLGVLLSFFLPYRYRYWCPDCGTGVLKWAKRCPGCGIRLE